VFWAAAQLQPRREHLALYFLDQAGFQTYSPRVRERILRRGHKVERLAPLFVGYFFVAIQSAWYPARWAPGVLRLIMNGETPAHVPSRIIEQLKGRERNGVIPLPKGGFALGETVRIVSGPLAGRPAIYAGQTAHERVIVLLHLLGVSRVELRRDAIKPAR
jgi:transcriptional antiterminator RfaH